jgi:cobalt-zinc-cadmium efflux system outer membrane protein
MKKILFSSLLLTSLLPADGFEELLEKALTHSPYLHASQLDIEVQQQQSETQLRYDNPSLGVDIERFDPDTGRDKDGYSVNISQPIRLWGVGDDKKALGILLQKGASLAYAEKKAYFIKALSLAYVRYSKAQKLEALSQKELLISKRIYSIAKRRYKAGNIAQKELLHAKTLMQKQAIDSDAISLEKMQRYYDLLSLSGLNEEIKLAGSHTFTLVETKGQNPELARLQNRLDAIQAKAKVQTRKVESIYLNANYEKEYEQDISSLGLSFPLALFNTKSQEKKIAILQAKQGAFKIEQAMRQRVLLEKKLIDKKEQLGQLRSQQEALLGTQQRLLKMFQEGYKIAKSNLLELQNAKNSLLETKKRVIELEAIYKQTIIETNYLRGAYHD